MAIFNPDVADEQASYLGLSKPITTPEFKSSSAVKIKATGDLLAGGLQAADTVVKQFAETETRQAMEAERDAYSKHLDQVKANIQMASVNPSGTTSDVGNVPVGSSRAADEGALNLLPNAASLPSDIKDLPRKLTTLDSARANGKIDEGDFFARTNVVLKDIRSRYPLAYRSYIDDVAKDVLGFDSANAQIKNTLGNINSYLGSQQAEKNHLLRLIESHAGYDGSQQAYINVMSGKWNGADVMINFLAPIQQEEFRKNKAAADRKDALDRRAFEEKSWEDDLNERASGLAARKITALQNFGELPPDHTLQPGEVEYYTAQARAAKASYEAEMEKYITTDPNGVGVTHAKLLGPKARQIIKDNGAYFDSQIKLITDREFGIAHSNERLIDFIKKNDDMAYLKDKTGLGWAMRMQGSVDRLAPSMTKDFYTTGLGDKKFDLPTKQQKFFEVQSLEQMGVNPSEIKPMKDKFDEARKDGIDLPQFRDKWISTIDSKTGHSLLNPATPDTYKERIAISAFQPKNFEFIGSLYPDQFDSKGNKIQGKETVYRRWTSDEVAAEMKRLGKANPELWNMYRNWVSYTTNKLYGEDLQNLEQQMPNLPKGAEITWNDKTQELGLNFGNQVNVHKNYMGPETKQPTVVFGPGRVADPAIPVISRVINKLNNAMSAASNVGKADETVDVNGYALQVLRGAGVDLSKVNGIPKAIQDAILEDLKQKKELEEAKAKYKPK